LNNLLQLFELLLLKEKAPETIQGLLLMNVRFEMLGRICFTFISEDIKL
jgi:hypothetical protein